MKRKLISAALGLTGLLAAGSASAVFVESFEYTLNGGFVADTALCQSGANCVNAGGDMSTLTVEAPFVGTLGANVDVYSFIDWGTDVGNGLSSLTSWQNDAAAVGGIDTSEALGDVTGDGTILADGVTERVGTVFEHANVPIAADDQDLSQVGFYENFEITATNPAVTGPITPTITGALFGILFNETFNEDNVGDCSDAQQSGTACDDFFVLLNDEELNPSVEVCDEGECWDYLFSISTDGLQIVNTADLEDDFGITLTAAQAAAAGATVGVLITQEGLTNRFEFNFKTRHVPEPGTLALMGLGLAGLGFRQRRRKAA